MAFLKYYYAHMVTIFDNLKKMLTSQVHVDNMISTPTFFPKYSSIDMHAYLVQLLEFPEEKRSISEVSSRLLIARNNSAQRVRRPNFDCFARHIK